MKEELTTLLGDLDKQQFSNLKVIGQKVSDIIMSGSFPDEIDASIREAYSKLEEWKEEEVDFGKYKEPDTEVMLILGDPYVAFSYSSYPVKGVGLMRLEFVINNGIFCRTRGEARKVINLMNEFGLKQGWNNLEIYMMCEIPSNVFLAEAFAEIFNGFSIGSNDLTLLTLSLDRESALVSHLFDEQNEASKLMISMAIERAKKKDVKIGLDGQAPSDFPEFAKFLVEQVSAVSLSILMLLLKEQRTF